MKNRKFTFPNFFSLSCKLILKNFNRKFSDLLKTFLKENGTEKYYSPYCIYLLYLLYSINYQVKQDDIRSDRYSLDLSKQIVSFIEFSCKNRLTQKYFNLIKKAFFFKFQFKLFLSLKAN